MKLFRAVCGLGALLVLVSSVGLAQMTEKRTLFTFNRPIALPGVTLPAGQYLFRVSDASATRRVVHVSSADGSKTYGLLFSIAAERLEASTAPEVRFMETGKNRPSAVKTYWYPNDRIGYEFIYPKEQARLLALDEAVLTTRTETTKPAETESAPLERLSPSGEVAVAETATPTAVAPTGESQAGTVAPESTVARNELPRTGSSLPLVFFIGILALAGAATMRLGWMARG